MFRVHGACGILLCVDTSKCTVADAGRRGWLSAVGVCWLLLWSGGNFGVVSGYLLSSSQRLGAYLKAKQASLLDRSVMNIHF